jgi:SPP1 family predicted phage head-tail adaptor
MDPGQRKCKVTLQRLVDGQDEIGQPGLVWADVATVYAAMGRAQSGIEAVRADAPASISTVSVRIRRRAGVDATMRLKYGAVVYEIVAVAPPDGNKQYVDLVCKVVNGGI